MVGAKPFTGIEEAMQDIKDSANNSSKGPSQSQINNLRTQLNRAFPDTRCTTVLYTKNDKLFFGMSVFPDVPTYKVGKIIQTNDPMRIESYALEIDSKLFDPFLNLTSRELTAIVLHEIGHMTNTSRPVDEVRKALDIYVMRTDSHVLLKSAKGYNEILRYAIQDTLIKVTSIFYDKDEEFKADSFAIKNGYIEDLESAMTKIYKNGLIVNRDINDNFIVLAWALRLYRNINLRRIPALRVIAKAKSLSPSELEKRSLTGLSSVVKTIDDEAMRRDEGFIRPVDIKESVRFEDYIILEGNVLGKKVFDAKLNNIKSFEGDLYEYRMMITNIEDHDEALLVMRQINARINILEDMRQNKECTGDKADKLDKLINQYRELRSDLASKVTYKDRFAGLVVNYPAIKGLDY